MDKQLTSSNHNAILFGLKGDKSEGIHTKRLTRNYNIKKTNRGEFCEKLTQSCEENNINTAAIGIINNSKDLDTQEEKLQNSLKKPCEETAAKIALSYLDYVL